MISHTKLIFGIIIIVLHLSLAGLFSQNNIPPQKQKSGLVTLTGRVLDRETKQPLIGTNVVIAGTNIGGSTDQNGNYTISNLTPGKYEIDFFYIGYKTERIKNFRVAANPGVRLDVQLEVEPLQLREIIVTPGQFAVMGRQPFVRQTLTKQNLQTIPFGEDVYRAITRLPGVSSEDYSARFTIRGGKNEDILVLMDGLQLYEPFHLKDVDGGVLSIVDVEAIKGIDLFTGGYPAEYGECMSGVFSINSSDAEEDRSQTSLGLSFMNSRFKSEGRFTHNRGSWLVSARRGYLDLILNMMGEKDAPQPVYYDLFGKVKYNMNKSQSISASILHSGDKLSFVEEEDGDEVSTRYGNSYGWLTLTSIINPRLFTRTMVSFGRITHNRQGTGYFDDTGGLEFIVADDNRVNIFGLKQDWDFEIDKRWLLKWGFYYNNETADYDYRNTLTHRTWIDNSNYMLKTDSTLAKLNPDGERYGGYLTNRFRIIKPLTIEAGLRYDRNTYAGDRYFSPRFNMVYALGKQTFLRGGWGYYYQSQRMHEIKAAWGETDFYPVQVAEHRVAGLEHTFGNGLNLRLEGYYKDISDMRPDYRTFSNTVELFPEIEDDVFTLTFNGAKSKGLEFFLKYDRGGKFSYWASYGLARADEDIRSLIYRGKELTIEKTVFPNRNDQRHAIYLDFNYRPNRKWHLNVSWQFHTGWPYTRKVMRSRKLPDGRTEYYSEYEQLYANRFSPYHRMDLQLNRYFQLSSSRVSVFLALINVYNHDNVRNIKYNQKRDANGKLYLEERKEYWFPLLPSIGVSWNWDH